METRKKVERIIDSNIKLKINNDVNGLDTKLFIIQRLAKYDVPISQYQFAKDIHMSTAHVFYHFKPLLECGVIIQINKKYQINPCFKYSSDILETLQPFFNCLWELNSNLSTDQLSDLASYLLAMVTIEVKDIENEN